MYYVFCCQQFIPAVPTASLLLCCHDVFLGGLSPSSLPPRLAADESNKRSGVVKDERSGAVELDGETVSSSGEEQQSDPVD